MKVVMLLLTLCLVPAAVGIFRLVTLASGHVTPETARFFDSPWPMMLHLVAVVPYSILGALQFAPSLRKNRWHRITGRLLTPLAMIAALTGLWMAHFYPWPPMDGQAVYVFRLVAGSGMAISVVLGIAAIVRRDYVAHGEWMTRGYALGMGAGTQVLTHLPWVLTVGMPGEVGRAIAMGAGWLINIVVAEYVIRRSRSRVTSRRSSATRLSSSGSRETQSLAQ